MSCHYMDVLFRQCGLLLFEKIEFEKSSSPGGGVVQRDIPWLEYDNCAATVLYCSWRGGDNERFLRKQKLKSLAPTIESLTTQCTPDTYQYQKKKKLGCFTRRWFQPHTINVVHGRNCVSRVGHRPCYNFFLLCQKYDEQKKKKCVDKNLKMSLINGGSGPSNVEFNTIPYIERSNSHDCL